MALHIRQLEAEEVALLRQLRLRALRDAPEAFGDSYDHASEQPSEYWDRLTANLTGDAEQRMFIAQLNGVAVGSTFALGDSDDEQGANLGGMWVDSNFPGKGVGQALAESVLEWARSVGHVRVRLWVIDEESAARRLYRRVGFRETGESDRTRAKIDADIVRMDCLL